MEISNSTASIPKLPDDLIIEILSRLPTRSLLKFRCVSKSWLSIISTPQFAKTHLKNSKKDPNYTSQKIILNSRGNLKQCSVHSLLYEPITEAFDFDYWFNISGSLIWVVGSCDGLICLSVDRKDLILWNPSTRIWKKLPDFAVRMSGPGGPGPGYGVGRAGRIATSNRGYFAYGFGFDKSSDDYKIVGFSNGNRDLSEVSVQVYSLKSDQWKMIKNFRGRWLMDDPATFANGKLYWIANRDMGLESAWDIVSLDLETEEYEVLQMPSYVKSGYYSRLNASGGCLYVLCSHLESADLWIMDDCSVGKGSWTNVVAIPYVDDFLKYTYKKAVYVLKDGQVVLLCGSTFVIFDAKDCSFRYPEVRNSGEFVAVTTYFESLVSPS